jgi:hypothetical protein
LLLKRIMLKNKFSFFNLLFKILENKGDIYFSNYIIYNYL